MTWRPRNHLGWSVCSEYIGIVTSSFKITLFPVILNIAFFLSAVLATWPLTLRGYCRLSLLHHPRNVWWGLWFPLFHLLRQFFFVVLSHWLFPVTICLECLFSSLWWFAGQQLWLHRLLPHYLLHIFIFNDLFYFYRLLSTSLFGVQFPLKFFYVSPAEEGQFFRLVLDREEVNEEAEDHLLAWFTWDLELGWLAADQIAFKVHVGLLLMGFRGRLG